MPDLLPYDALLALHLLAVATFLAGLLLLLVILPGLTRARLSETRREEVARLGLIDRWMIRPALLFVWLCGIGMTLQAGWYATGWLRLKVACVAVLTILYADRARQLRGLVRGRTVRPAGHGPLWLALALVLAIGTLVVAKPF